MHFVFAGQHFNLHKKSPFETLYDLFKKLMLISSGDIDQALEWLEELNNQYDITKNMEADYSLEDFVKELENRGYIKRDKEQLRKIFQI